MALDAARPSRPVRWWPAALVTMLYLGVLILVWTLEAKGQTVTVVLAATLVWLLSLLIWITFLARVGSMTVTSVWLSLILAVLVFVSLFRFRGVSGDLVPLFEPRWWRVVEAMAAQEAAADDVAAPEPAPATNAGE